MILTIYTLNITSILFKINIEHTYNREESIVYTFFWSTQKPFNAIRNRQLKEEVVFIFKRCVFMA